MGKHSCLHCFSLVNSYIIDYLCTSWFIIYALFRVSCTFAMSFYIILLLDLSISITNKYNNDTLHLYTVSRFGSNGLTARPGRVAVHCGSHVVDSIYSRAVYQNLTECRAHDHWPRLTVSLPGPSSGVDPMIPQFRRRRGWAWSLTK